MKIRVAAATAVIGALVLSMSGAQAATPVMDGKKVKVLTLKANGGLQDHEANQVTGLLSSTEAVDCVAPDCSRLSFVYKPAKGAKGGLLFSMTWTNPASDFDLYVAEVDKRGNNTEIANCATAGPPSEKAYIPAASLKSGKTYVMVIYHFRSINDVATGKVEMGVPDSVKTTVPAKADEFADLNCSL